MFCVFVEVLSVVLMVPVYLVNVFVGFAVAASDIISMIMIYPLCCSI